MHRRKFLGVLTLVGAGELTALKYAEPVASHTVTYKIDGFTCITCAVGLDAMLEKQKGIFQSISKYPSGISVIKYNAGITNEDAIRTAISEIGFRVVQHTSGDQGAQF